MSERHSFPREGRPASTRAPPGAILWSAHADPPLQQPQPVTDARSRLATALSDRYRIERELGQGGMATVYLAEDLKHHRKVAIKVLRPELAHLELDVLGAAPH